MRRSFVLVRLTILPAIKPPITPKGAAFRAIGGALVKICAPEMPGAAQFSFVCAALTVIGGPIYVSGVPEIAGGGPVLSVYPPVRFLNLRRWRFIILVCP
ncbi:MAG: hypothetical protein QM800_05495 [Paludibacter sp.]